MSPISLEVDEGPERPRSEIPKSKEHTSKLSSQRVNIPESQYDEVEMAYDARLNAISELNQMTSPLLRLPPELRNRIYSYALSDRVLVHPAIQQPLAMPYEPDSSMHNLPLVCRQLYRETHLLVYRFGTFDIGRPDWFAEFVKGREPVKTAITRIRLMGSELYWIALSLNKDFTDDFAWNWDASGYHRCFKELRGMRNLQQIVCIQDRVWCCPPDPDFVPRDKFDLEPPALAAMVITGRGDVELTFV